MSKRLPFSLKPILFIALDTNGSTNGFHSQFSDRKQAKRKMGKYAATVKMLGAKTSTAASRTNNLTVTLLLHKQFLIFLALLLLMYILIEYKLNYL